MNRLNYQRLRRQETQRVGREHSTKYGMPVPPMDHIQASLKYLGTSWMGTDEDKKQYAQLKDLERKCRAIDDKYGLSPSDGTKPSQKMSEPVSRGKTLKELLGIEKEQG